jgi:hypothetical protein
MRHTFAPLQGALYSECQDEGKVLVNGRLGDRHIPQTPRKRFPRVLRWSIEVSKHWRNLESTDEVSRYIYLVQHHVSNHNKH